MYLWFTSPFGTVFLSALFETCGYIDGKVPTLIWLRLLGSPKRNAIAHSSLEVTFGLF